MKKLLQLLYGKEIQWSGGLSFETDKNIKGGWKTLTQNVFTGRITKVVYHEYW